VDHAEGRSYYTATRLPIRLLYVEYFATRDEAFVAERKIKGWSRRKKEAYIKKNFEVLHELAKCRSE
jgi:putative endonuclease